MHRVRVMCSATSRWPSPRPCLHHRPLGRHSTEPRQRPSACPCSRRPCPLTSPPPLPRSRVASIREFRLSQGSSPTRLSPPPGHSGLAVSVLAVEADHFQRPVALGFPCPHRLPFGWQCSPPQSAPLWRPPTRPCWTTPSTSPTPSPSSAHTGNAPGDRSFRRRTPPPCARQVTSSTQSRCLRLPRRRRSSSSRASCLEFYPRQGLLPHTPVLKRHRRH